jgi:5'-3' exonuclease
MRVLIVDGNNMIARGTHVLPNAVDPNGRAIGGMYITLKMIRTFLGSEPHDAVVVALDWGVPKFRKEVCPEYKGKREENLTPEEERIRRLYKEQVKFCHELFKPFGMVTARAKDWEGDDVVAALCLRKLENHECTIMSSDRDFTQLVDSSRVRLWDVGKDRWTEGDPYWCLKRCMDPKVSDNLDGAPGIGPAKADKLIQAWLADELTRPKDSPSASTDVERFLAWAHKRVENLDSIGKLAKKVDVVAQKMRANWKCTHMPDIVDGCAAALKFRRTEPDKHASKEALKDLGLRPFAEDFGSLWPPFAGLKCPV